MRLIDADSLINEMKKWYWDSEKQRTAELDNSPMDLFTNLAITTVKEQPTAYDIDKVVEELEVLINIAKRDYDLIRETTLLVSISELQRAIEIVKQGKEQK